MDYDEALKDIEEIKSYLLGQFGEETTTKNKKKVIKEIRTLSSFPLKGTGIGARCLLICYNPGNKGVSSLRGEAPF